jgi:RNA polymerase sigma-70 factor (ECF subfamily)
VQDSVISPVSDPCSPNAESDNAFVALLTTHQSSIHAFLSSLLPGDSGVEDVLQRANVVLWNKRGDFDFGSNFKAWAFSIARWETRAWLTERKRQNWLVFDDELTDSIIQHSIELQESAAPNDSGIVQALRMCLAQLSDKQRLLVMSYYQHEKSFAECASLTKRSEGSLRVTLFRVRTKLRSCIESKIAMGGVA